jgi:hypothetical protein
MRLRERVGEWWIEVRPGPSWGGKGALVRAVAGGGLGRGGDAQWAFCRLPFSGAWAVGACIARRKLR